MDRKLLAALALAAVAVFWLWDSWALYPLKLVVVLFHESGHALTAWATGGHVDSIEIDHRQGGLTHFRTSGGFFSGILIASGGYLGSTFFGATILAAAARLRSGKPVLLALSAFLLAALLLWVRDPFTAAFTLGVALLLAAAARLLPPAWSRSAALFLGTFTALYAIWDIRDDLLTTRLIDRQTDAQQLAASTGIPALLWALSWGAISLGAIWLSIKTASAGRGRAPRVAPGPRPLPRHP